MAFEFKDRIEDLELIEEYFDKLDNMLETLSRTLGGEDGAHQRESVLEFGEKNNWNWDRIPLEDRIYSDLSVLVDKVRGEYKWFKPILDSEDPKENRLYFDRITVNERSGLPWDYSFMTLSQTRDDADRHLSEIESDQELFNELERELLGDNHEDEELHDGVKAISRTSLKRSFLEQLRDAEISSWNEAGNKYGIRPKGRMIDTRGYQTLWNVSHVNYPLGQGMFEIYSIDFWQDEDTEAKEIYMDLDGNVVVSDDLIRNLSKYSLINPAYHILSSLDFEFDHIHPVHVSRGIVGPYDNKFLKVNERLPITNEIVEGDEDFAMLRFTRQYAYAPNHEEVNGRIRQVIHQDDWKDAVIICPSYESGKVSKSVLGDKVRVVEV